MAHFNDWCLSDDEPVGPHFRRVMTGQTASLPTGIQATATTSATRIDISKSANAGGSRGDTLPSNAGRSPTGGMTMPLAGAPTDAAGAPSIRSSELPLVPVIAQILWEFQFALPPVAVLVP